MWTARSDGRLFLALVAALLMLAWLTLIIWGQTPYAVYLNHGSLGHVGGGFSGPYVRYAAVFIAGWALMTIAMMLPSSLPMVMLFRTITRSREDRLQLSLLLLGAYVVVWTLFGSLAHLGDYGIHRSVASVPWIADHSGVLAALPLLLAGAYQFTPLKYGCLEKCRSPYSFLIQHWRGGDSRLQALRLGLHHALFCVGCCWALMLLMFAVGVGNVGWMLVLATIMAAEKNMSWGGRLSVPLGVVLYAAGIAVLLVGGAKGACAC